ncbi:MAG TPA: hypothetical protein VNZ54_07480 [bacterium]|nr:hypothetical protein [bacterium]HXC64256.1 hypothetical protein [bacterium]
MAEQLKAKRRETLEADRERAKRLLPLKVGYYFDPVTREVLRKVGSQYVFVRHDRRRTNRSGNDQQTVKLKPIQGGLYWDAVALAIYQFRNGQYVLYSKDRRKAFGPIPTGKDRRKSK